MKIKCPVCGNSIIVTKQKQISPIKVWGGEILEYKVEWQCINFPQKCNCNGGSRVSKKELDKLTTCQESRYREEETIYDFVADAVLPLSQASTESLRNYVRNTPDDGYIEHNMLLGCIRELEKRGVYK